MKATNHCRKQDDHQPAAGFALIAVLLSIAIVELLPSGSWLSDRFDALVALLLGDQRAAED